MRVFLPAALLAVTAAGPLLAQCPDGTPPPCRTQQVARAAPAAAPHPLSVAVLPFQNRSPDPGDAYLAEGMTEEIANRLAQLGRLQVKARGLVEAQWRRTPDPFDAARRLNVLWFVHGSVRHAGSQLLVNVELVRTTSGEEAWASRFPRPDADVFAVQAEVAESVAAVVGGRLSPTERATIARRPTANEEAYRLYLLGNTLLKRRTQADVRRAVEAYTEAVRLDPRFVLSWSRLALARVVQFSWGWDEGMPGESLLSAGRVAARLALSFDSLSAEAWTAAASVAANEGDIGVAQRGFERSLRLDSLNAEVYHWYGATVYSAEGVHSLSDQAAAPLLRRALALDPDLRNTWRHLALMRREAGRLAEAEALLDTALSIGPWGPGFENRAFVRFLRGNGVGALADLSEAQRLGGTRRQDIHMLASIALGDSAPARAGLVALRARADGGETGLQGGIATLSVALGHRDEALAALERMRATPDPREPRCSPTATCSTNLATWRLIQNPIFAPLRSEPRFIRLLEDTRPRIPWR